MTLYASTYTTTLDKMTKEEIVEWLRWKIDLNHKDMKELAQAICDNFGDKHPGQEFLAACDQKISILESSKILAEKNQAFREFKEKNKFRATGICNMIKDFARKPQVLERPVDLLPPELMAMMLNSLYMNTYFPVICNVHENKIDGKTFVEALSKCKEDGKNDISKAKAVLKSWGEQIHTVDPKFDYIFGRLIDLAVENKLWAPLVSDGFVPEVTADPHLHFQSVLYTKHTIKTIVKDGLKTTENVYCE